MNKKGFTLIETIMYIFLTSFLLSNLINFGFYIYRDNNKNNEQINNLFSK